MRNFLKRQILIIGQIKDLPILSVKAGQCFADRTALTCTKKGSVKNADIDAIARNIRLAATFAIIVRAFSSCYTEDPAFEDRFISQRITFTICAQAALLHDVLRVVHIGDLEFYKSLQSAAAILKQHGKAFIIQSIISSNFQVFVKTFS